MFPPRMTEFAVILTQKNLVAKTHNGFKFQALCLSIFPNIRWMNTLNTMKKMCEDLQDA